MPRHPAYQPHVGIASEEAASASLYQQDSSPYGPKQGDTDPSVNIPEQAYTNHTNRKYLNKK